MNLKSLLKLVKLNESTISMILGALVIIVVGVLVINYFGGKEEGITIPPVDTEDMTTTGLPTTHIVGDGEDLWTISEKYYGTGYNWVDIANENNIDNPGIIEKDQELTIPDVAPRIALANEQTETPTPTAFEQAQAVLNNEVVGDIYIVKPGENLWVIAERYYNSGYNWVDIAETNNLESPGLISVGQELSIPSVEAKKTTTIANKDLTTETISGATYTVEKGDNLWNIAVRAYGDGYRWTEIAGENNLENPNVIHTGNKLTLPR